MKTVTLASNFDANGRKYDMAEIDKAIEEYNKKGRHLCWLDHPSNNFTVTLSEVAGKVQKLWSEGNEVKAVIDILDTPNGLTAQSLMDNGCSLSLGVRMLTTGDPDNIHVKQIMDVGIKCAPGNKITEDEVLDFIRGMHNIGTVDVFLNGYCYWFAYILAERFKRFASTSIMYNQVLGHFAVKINDTLYDIRGKILNEDESGGNWEEWDTWKKNEPTYYKVVERDCILKLRN